jgi:hypothetical protein
MCIFEFLFDLDIEELSLIFAVTEEIEEDEKIERDHLNEEYDEENDE